MKHLFIGSYQLLVAAALATMLSACGGSSTVPLKSTSNNISSASTLAQSSIRTTSSQKSSAIKSSIATTSSTANISSAAANEVPEESSSIESSSTFSSTSSEIILPEPPVEESSSSTSSAATTSSSIATISSSSKIASSSRSSVASSSPTLSSSSTASTSVAAAGIYFVRGTHNNWNEGSPMTRVSTTNNYQSCINFTATDNNSFKIDPNGGWGDDTVPAENYPVQSGWVKVLFDSATQKISTETQQTANCGAAIYYLRGTQSATAWDQSDLFVPIDDVTGHYEICRNFGNSGGALFKIDPKGDWGADAFPAENKSASGWTKIIIDISTNAILNQQSDLAPYCTNSQ